MHGKLDKSVCVWFKKLRIKINIFLFLRDVIKSVSLWCNVASRQQILIESKTIIK